MKMSDLSPEIQAKILADANAISNATAKLTEEQREWIRQDMAQRDEKIKQRLELEKIRLRKHGLNI